MKALKAVTCCLIVIFALNSALIGASSSETQSSILYVKSGGEDNCSDWSLACDLQTALSEAEPGDQIWVAAGTYTPTATNDRTISFSLTPGVSVFGGFPDTGSPIWDDRDPWAHVTTLSGDIGAPNNNSDNSIHVVYGNGVDVNARLDGFTISRGNANGSGTNEWGGGMLLSNSYLTLQNISFKNNLAKAGGGLFVDYGSPTLDDVEFINNIVTINGGGMHTHHSANPTLIDVTFQGNHADSGWGGGMMNYSHNHPTLTNVHFWQNTAENGGGMSNNGECNPVIDQTSFLGNYARDKGGGMANINNSNPTLTNVTFSENYTDGDGGGMHNDGSNPTLTNVTFSNNWIVGDGVGGGMYNVSGSNPTLTSVTFSGNWAAEGGGMYNVSGSNPTLDNVTFSGNSAVNGGGMYTGGIATLTNVTFSENSADKDGGGMVIYGIWDTVTLRNVNFYGNSARDDGGGLYVWDGFPSMRDVTFFGNSADSRGGGMHNEANSECELKNVTFSGNSAYYGGGLSQSTSYSNITNGTFYENSAVEGGGIYNYTGSTDLTNVTLYGNSAIKGGGMSNHSFSISILINVIVWGNTGGQIDDNFFCNTPITYSDIQGGWKGTGNINADPFLGPLADNGGFTLTHALGAFSPAIDAGDPANCPAIDQRGVIRPVDGNGDGEARCDMGAYEFNLIEQIYLPLILK